MQSTVRFFCFILSNSILSITLLVLALGLQANFVHAEETGTPPSPTTGIETRPLWTTSRIFGSPEPPPPYTVERVYPNLKFKDPVNLILGPNKNRFYLTQYTGKILSFGTDQQTKDTAPFLELNMNIASIAFHPQFEEKPYVYVFGNTAPARIEGEVPRNRILRFNVTGSDILTADPDSQFVVLEYDSDGHNGGEAKFGPDGYLYITSGDGSGDSDDWNTGQDVSDLPGSMLRIDVDHPQDDLNYGIPDDNPFLEMDGARGEIWAYGFRNPWRFNFDTETGNLYIGDVGQDLWEMILLVQPGANYGWSVKEGNSDFHPLKKRGPTPIVPPLAEHHHTESRSITGGYVYRGTQMPDLVGVYIYGDYETGKIWGLRHDGNQVTWQAELANLSLKVPSFAVGANQEFLLIDYQNGELYQLIPAPKAEALPPFPRRLSETGIFTSTVGLQPAPGLIPYSVNSPQWLDGAIVQRYLGIPAEGKITFTATGAWQFPESTVLVKTISFPSSEKPDSTQHVETQILTLQANQWAGYTYVWNDEQTDAELAPNEGMDLTLHVGNPTQPEKQIELPWHIASRSECMFCHSRAAGFALGAQTPQLNRDHPYALRTANQIDTLNYLQVFKEPLKQQATELTSLANPYHAEEDINARARSYLHANCSHCHVGAGGGNAKILLTQQTKLPETFLVGGRPLHADFGIAGAMLVAPGDPDRSILYQRVSRRGNGQMPPLATSRVDHIAARLIHDWIQQIEIPESAQDDVDLAVAEVQGESGTLSRWYVAGPLNKQPNENQLTQTSSPPDPKISEEENVGNEELVTPKEEPLYSWQPTIGSGTECQIALASPSAAPQQIWLARTDISLAAESEIQLTTTSDQPLDLWINGKQLNKLSSTTASTTNRYDTKLQKGRNRLLVKLQIKDDSTPRFHVNFRRKSSNPKHEQYALAALSNHGNAERGQQLFFNTKKTQCATCHRIHDQGGDVGPNLTGLGERLSPARIIESILDPSRSVAPNYRTVLLELTSGRILTGINVAETSDSVTIKDAQNKQLVISKSNIQSLQIQPTSLMPEKLDELITQQEFVDLVTFLAQTIASEK